jgi:hypothetical protein
MSSVTFSPNSQTNGIDQMHNPENISQRPKRTADELGLNSERPDYLEMFQRVVAIMASDRVTADEERTVLHDVYETTRQYQRQKLIREALVEFKGPREEIKAARKLEQEKREEMDLAKMNAKILERRIKMNEGHRIGILALRKDMRESGG